MSAASDGRVVASRQCSVDGRFTVIGRRKAGCLNLRRLRVLPVVVRCNDGASRVKKLERRILQRTSNVKSGQRWPEGSDQHRAGGQTIAAKDEAAD